MLGMDKGNVAHIYSGILLSHLKKKKEQNNVICSNRDGPETVIMSKMSDRETAYDIACI